jgi:hypothetical protein
VTTVAKPSSSTWGQDAACFVAAVPQVRSFENGFILTNPGLPSAVCQAASWEAKNLGRTIRCKAEQGKWKEKIPELGRGSYRYVPHRQAQSIQDNL